MSALDEDPDPRPSPGAAVPAWKRKLRKLLRNPRLFFQDGWDKRFGRRVETLPPAPPRPLGDYTLDEVALLATGLFDADFYRNRYPDIARKGVDPLIHYLRHGAREGRMPNPFFDPQHYARHAGVPSRLQDLLLHYAHEGEALGLTPSPLINVQGGTTASSSSRSLAERLRDMRQQAYRLSLDAAHHDRDQQRKAVSVLVPVHNGGPQTVLACLTSLSRYTPSWCEVVLLDDASTDPNVVEVLREFSRRPRTRLIQNAENQGFTKTVNRGLLATSGDVVVLNSDTVVGPRWLDELWYAAHRSSRIATATALSDCAGAFSTPEPGINATRDEFAVDRAARLSRRAAPAEDQPVPTGNGFALYLKRGAIADVGLLDSDRFPMGYGEENDWCMRASERGWSHVIALRSYVRHENAASFGQARKAKLLEEGRKVLDELHPDYKTKVAGFSRATHLKSQRSRFAEALGGTAPGSVKPRLLFVVSSSTGGTPQTNQDLMRSLRPLYDAFLLTSDTRQVTLFDCTGDSPVVVCHHCLADVVGFLDHRSREYDEIVGGWLRQLDIELVHIRHVSWHSLGLIEVADDLGIPVVFSFHDYYCVCPSVNLTDGTRPWNPTGVATPHISSPLWHRLDSAGVERAKAMDGQAFLRMWRRRMSSVLARCSAFVTTTHSTRALLQENLPVLRERASDFHVFAHGRDFEAFRELASWSPEGPLRVLVPGNINDAKGAATLEALLELDRERAFEFHLLGNCITRLKNNPRIVHHGSYAREDFSEKVEPIAPTVSLIISIWPETFCHTLTESWALGIPVVGSELGAVGERIRESGAGWLVNPSDAPEIHRLLRRIRDDRASWQTRREAVRDWQTGPEAARNVDVMAEDYAHLYGGVLRGDGQGLAEPVRAKGHRRVAFVATDGPSRELGVLRQRLEAATSLVVFSDETSEELARTAARDYDAVVVARGSSSGSCQRFLARSLKSRGVPHLVYQPRTSDGPDSAEGDNSASSPSALVVGAFALLTSSESSAERLSANGVRVILLPWDDGLEGPSESAGATLAATLEEMFDKQSLVSGPASTHPTSSSASALNTISRS